MEGKVELQGFKALPVKFLTNTTTINWLFYKCHSVRKKTEGKPEDRTLFIINVPSYCTENTFKHMFQPCGTVTRVFFHEKPTDSLPLLNKSSYFPKHEQIMGYKVAYVVFEQPSELETALQWSVEEPFVVCSEKSPVIYGIRKWCQEYNEKIPDSESLQKDVDKFMERFDRETARTKIREKEKKMEEEEGEGGWITITKKGRKPGFARKESVHKKIMAQEKVRNSKKELLNFYTFQIRDSKMKHLNNLKQKFEEDKNKIQLMKKSRRFNPF